MRTEHIKPSRSQPEMVKGKDWKKKGGSAKRKVPEFTQSAGSFSYEFAV